MPQAEPAPAAPGAARAAEVSPVAEDTRSDIAQAAAARPRSARRQFVLSPNVCVTVAGGIIGSMILAMAGFMVNAFGAINDSISDLRLEFASVRAEIGSVREELRAEIGSVRGEVGSLRSEMHAEFANVREEMRVEFANVREEMREEFRLVHSVLRDHGERLARLEAHFGIRSSGSPDAPESPEAEPVEAVPVRAVGPHATVAFSPAATASGTPVAAPGRSHGTLRDLSRLAELPAGHQLTGATR